MEMQKFNIEIDGVEKEASVVNVLRIDDKEIVIYSVNIDNENSTLFYSQVVKDEEGYDKLVDIEDNELKQRVIGLINEMLS